MTLGERLIRLIRKRGLTQTRVSEASGVSRQQVNRIVKGSLPNPGILTVEKIVEGIGSTMREFYED